MKISTPSPVTINGWGYVLLNIEKYSKTVTTHRNPSHKMRGTISATLYQETGKTGILAINERYP